MEITDVVDQAGAIIAITAGIGILLLLPLYLSQRRDLRRLVEWMEAEPEHPVADAASSEQILDRAETELERLTGEQPVVVAEPSGAAARVTSERPALERVTMERAALLPHRTPRGRISPNKSLIQKTPGAPTRPGAQSACLAPGVSSAP